jgi:replicative DNA helicase
VTQWLKTPAESASYYVWWAEQIQNSPGITYGCVLDKVLIPLHPGDLMAVVARSSHGKSSFMAYMARRAALQIQAAGKAEEQCVVYVTWEQSIEEIEAFFQCTDQYTSTDMAWGRAPMEHVIKGSFARPGLPVWVMGHSIMRPELHGDPMYVEAIYEEIRWLAEKFHTKPMLICLDYLQIIPVHKAGERNQQVHEAVIQAKELAMTVGVPVIAGVQASRAVDNRKSPIPMMGDAQWSSSIEQTADKQIALFRPIREYAPEDEPTIKVGANQYANVPELLVIRVLKQRFDVGHGTYAVRFEPQTLTMADYDVIRLND